MHHPSVLSRTSIPLCLAILSVLFVLSPTLKAEGNVSAVGQYNGAGGCAASSCHGSIQAKQVTRVLQNEYTTWVTRDKHSRAYDVLSSEVSRRIGRILDDSALDPKERVGPPNQSPKCLSCHSLAIPKEKQAQSFEAKDGVGCENCHGPASGWLGAHTARNWKHEDSVRLGMTDLRGLTGRTEVCLSCHLGTPDKFVDHEMIAAGHPDLTFDLELFSAVMPRHWSDPADKPWRGVQSVAVGDAVELRQSLLRLQRRASGNKWPEYGELDCFACHHSLTKPEDSWRQRQGYSGRQAGVAAWNESRYVVFRILARQMNSDAASRLDAEMAKLTRLMGQISGNRQEIADTAGRAAATAEQLSKEFDGGTYDRALALRMMRGVAADGNQISAKGERAAEQAVMTLDGLYTAYSGNSGNRDTPMAKAISNLFDLVNSPSAYNASNFAAQMQKASALLEEQRLASGTN